MSPWTSDILCLSHIHNIHIMYIICSDTSCNDYIVHYTMEKQAKRREKERGETQSATDVAKYSFTVDGYRWNFAVAAVTREYLLLTIMSITGTYFARIRYWAGECESASESRRRNSIHILLRGDWPHKARDDAYVIIRATLGPVRYCFRPWC